MSSPVSTRILKLRGRGAPSAQNGLSGLGQPAPSGPAARSWSGRAAPRFLTFWKRCVALRTTKQAFVRAYRGSQRGYRLASSEKRAFRSLHWRPEWFVGRQRCKNRRITRCHDPGIHKGENPPKFRNVQRKVYKRNCREYSSSIAGRNVQKTELRKSQELEKSQSKSNMFAHKDCCLPTLSIDKRHKQCGDRSQVSPLRREESSQTSGLIKQSREPTPRRLGNRGHTVPDC